MSDRQLTDGNPVPEDGSHKTLRPDGQQVDYVVLTPEERAKGFAKPLRHSYIHAYPSETDRQVGCGGETMMGTAIAETYARNPRFYSGTFCAHCRAHFPLEEFTWAGGGELSGEPMDPDLQETWLIETRATRAREAEDRRRRRIAELRAEIEKLEASS